jgi:hypothetical protein
VACPTGKFRGTMQIDCACTDCPSGKFNDVTSTTVCTNCEKGTYSVSNAETCTDCAPGKKASTEGKSMCDSCKPGMYAATTKSQDCFACAGGEFQSISGRTGCKNCPGGKYNSEAGKAYCMVCASGDIIEPSCSGAMVPPTQQLALTLDLVNDLVEPSSLLTRTAALTQLDTVQNQLTTCASTFTEEKAFAQQEVANAAVDKAASAKALGDAKTAKATLQGEKDACESRTAVPTAAPTTAPTNAPTNAPTAAATTGAVSSCAGSVAIDTNGNGKVESADAVELFVATTMQGYGAASMINRFRAKHLTGALTPVKAIIANVKAAMAATAQAGKSAATTL